VAAFFACEVDGRDGEIWSFCYDRYVTKGNDQWITFPETLRDGKWDARFTAFTAREPPDWFVCGFYSGFPRQDAQQGLYGITAQFGRGHEQAIASLLDDPSSFHLYIIPSKLKSSLQVRLRELHGIWRGSLFPDSAGAAMTVTRSLFPG
jgi:hypothetical protein